MAFPALNFIKIERQDFVGLAKQIMSKLKELTNVSDDHPKNYFYSLFMLDKYINEN